jgi:hypothetical protein
LRADADSSADPQSTSAAESPQPGAGASPSEAPATPARIRWLVAVHVLLAAAPLVHLLVAQNMVMTMMPLIWATYSAPIGSLMALSFWVGMGGGRLAARLVIGLVASVYVATWPFLTMTLLGVAVEAQTFALNVLP